MDMEVDFIVAVIFVVVAVGMLARLLWIHGAAMLGGN
jgi:hypothetical protein